MGFETEGYFVAEDVGMISNPSPGRAVGLQTKTVNGRTAGILYRYTTAGVWQAVSLGQPGFQQFNYQVENLAAGADIGDGTAANARSIWIAPAALAISKISIISQGSPAGIDAGNTSAIKLYRGANTIVTKTYNDVTIFPANHAQDDLGTLSNATFAAGEDLRMDLVNGATADPPAFMVQVEFSYTG